MGVVFVCESFLFFSPLFLSGSSILIIDGLSWGVRTVVLLFVFDIGLWRLFS